VAPRAYDAKTGQWVVTVAQRINGSIENGGERDPCSLCFGGRPQLRKQIPAYENEEGSAPLSRDAPSIS
jgi:hypothetical protein